MYYEYKPTNRTIPVGTLTVLAAFKSDTVLYDMEKKAWHAYGVPNKKLSNKRDELPSCFCRVWRASLCISFLNACKLLIN